jgi:hypothetical protein
MAAMNLLLALSLSAAAAPAPKLEKIELVAKGVFETRVQAKAATGGAVMGRVDLVQEKLVEETEVIRARPKLQFGVRVKAVGQPRGAVVRLNAVTVFPKPGLPDPKTGKKVLKEVLELDFKLGETSYQGYEFTYPWEIVPGLWAFELWQGDKRVSRQTFTVEKTK